MDELAALRSWRGEPFAAFALLLAAVVYIRGWFALQHQAPLRFPQWRLISFLLGLGFLYVVVASPLDTFAGFLLQVHMVQHLMLTMVVPPLLLLGAPWLPVLRGLPRVWVRDVGGPLLKGVFWQKLTGLFAHPVTSWLLFVGSNLIWHLPPFYEATLHSDNLHAFEHICFLSTSLLFWFHVILPWPAHPHGSRWLMIPYLLLADLQNTALGAFLSFYDHPLYASYEAVPRLWGIDVMTDQTSAGAIMWVPGSVAFLLPAGFIAFQLLSSPRRFADSDSQHLTVPARSKKTPWFIRLARTPTRRILQVFLLLLAVVVVLDGLFGPPVASMNLAGVLPWTYWRGLSVIALLTVGNFFCSVCPFVLARDMARRVWTPGWLWPKSLRNKWSAVGLLATFLWAYEVFGLWNRPTATAILIIAYFASAIVIDVLFRGASFCKYVCPIGQYHFAFSTNSSKEIGVQNPQVCAGCKTHDCLRGNDHDRGCELHLFQPSKSGNIDCTGCLDCVRACPHDNVGLLTVVPTRDLASNRFRSTLGYYSQRADLAALFGLFVIGALVNAGGMISPVVIATATFASRFGLPETVITSLFIATAFSSLILAGWLAAWASNPRTNTRHLLIAFTPAFVPMGAAIWAAHFLFHLATGAFTIIPVTQRFLGDLGFSFAGKPDWSWMGFSGDGIMGIELALLNAGALASLYLLWKICEREFQPGSRLRGFWPWAIFLLLIFAPAIWTMFQPMDMRGTMMSGH